MINEVISIVFSLEGVTSQKGLSNLFSLHEEISKNAVDYEFILIKPVGFTHPFFKDVMEKISFLRCIEVIDSLAIEKAFGTGMDIAIGDVVVLFSPEIDPHDMVMQGISLQFQNEETSYVIGKFTSKFSLLFCLRTLFYKIAFSISGLKISSHSSTFRVVPRSLINSTQSKIFKGLYLFTRLEKKGYETNYIEYAPLQFKLKNLTIYFSNFVSLLISSPNRSLRMMSLVGSGTSLLSFIVAFIVILSKLIENDAVEGWSSTVVIISVLFAILFLLISFLIEYLLKIVNLDMSNHSVVVNEFSNDSDTLKKKLNVKIIESNEDEN